jgi:heme/copper-type cytochrome/quinol oxidase subunit 3
MSYLVPRTSEARNPRDVARIIPARAGRPVAWWGMVMLVASEATLFGCLFGTYYYLRFKTPHWPPVGVPEPRVVVPLILSFTLAATAGPLLLATRAARAGRVGIARLLLVLALIVQAGYFAYEVHDFGDQLKGFTPQTDAYGSIYYVLLGADHGHVAVGLLLDVWLLLKLARGLNTYRLNALQAVSVYWYAVVVLTLCVTGTLLSATV